MLAPGWASCGNCGECDIDLILWYSLFIHYAISQFPRLLRPFLKLNTAFPLTLASSYSPSFTLFAALSSSLSSCFLPSFSLSPPLPSPPPALTPPEVVRPLQQLLYLLKVRPEENRIARKMLRSQHPGVRPPSECVHLSWRRPRTSCRFRGNVKGLLARSSA